MTNEQMLKNLSVPERRIDAVIDTDAYNEVDDQFAICYMLAAEYKINTKAIYAAPFHNARSTGAADGMEKSYNEILKILKLTGKNIDVFKGSDSFLKNETEFTESDAARDLVKRAKAYSPENPLYVVAIGAITNVASAILMEPLIAENIVVVWLGGNALDKGGREFNMQQDFAAARVVMGSKAPFVQLPCEGVVSSFTVSGPEIREWFSNKGKIADYLAKNVLDEVALHIDVNGVWSRIIWDVTAVGWLLNDNEQFMRSRLIGVRLPTYEGSYSDRPIDKQMSYVEAIYRDALLSDLIDKIKLLG